MKVILYGVRHPINSSKRVMEFISSEVNRSLVIAFHKVEEEDLKDNSCYPFFLADFNKNIKVKFKISQNEFKIYKTRV
ncbi:MAG: hypothetical protein WHV28_09630 [Bacteroidota bacterium]